MNAIDLFCGVGGMSLGFRQAGFKVLAAFDREDRHVSTYNMNFGEGAARSLDLENATGDEVRELSGLGKKRLDVVFGGPPCQGFSIGGKRDLTDKRNLLVYSFVRLVRQLRPAYFVMENVDGLLQPYALPVLKSFCRRARLAGYEIVTPIRILDAAKHGVPQRRRRCFVLGYKKNLTPPAYPTSTPITDEEGRTYYPTVRDAILDLPDVDKHSQLFELDGFAGPLGAPSHYARLMRGELSESLNVFEPSKEQANSMLTGCLRTRHSVKTVKRFGATLPGDREPVSRYYRLKEDGVAPTIRAGTGNDHGSHTAPRPIHPTRPRCITVREAARLHTYPDWFRFHETRWHAFRQLGNSVPPRLARSVAEQLKIAIQRGKANDKSKS